MSLLCQQCFIVQNYGLCLPHRKKLETAHHKFQRSTLSISWKDEVRNDKVRDNMTLAKLELIVKERSLEVARSSLVHGWQKAAKAGSILGSGYHKAKTRKTKKELDGYHTPRSEGDGTDLGKSTTAICQQRRMALKCGPKCVRHRMNWWTEVKYKDLITYYQFLPAKLSSISVIDHV